MTHLEEGWVGRFHRHLIVAPLVGYQLKVAPVDTFKHVFYENTTFNDLLVCMKLFIVGRY